MHAPLGFTAMKTGSRIAGALALLCAVLVAAYFFPLSVWIAGFVKWVASLGALGAVVYALVYVAGTVLLVPGTILTAGGGFLYGPLLGVLLVSPASVAGATFSFLLSRSFAREWTQRRVARYPRFDVLDRAIAKQGFKIVLLMRLEPIFVPFAMLNYALGLSRVRLRDYVLASWLGMLPATTLYVYLGSSALNIAELVQGKAPATGFWHQALFWGGLLAAAILVFVLTRVARQALRQELGPENGDARGKGA